MINNKIKVLVMDVDGTLTDGKIYMGNNGEFIKAFDIKDGCGIHDILPSYGIIPIVMTARSSEIVQNRCKELGINHLYQGVREKKTKLMEIVSTLGFTLEETAYIGDDIIDLECMKICGICACPADAVEKVKKICHFVSSKNGGNGAVRDFIEWLIEQ